MGRGAEPKVTAQKNMDPSREIEQSMTANAPEVEEGMWTRDRTVQAAEAPVSQHGS